jgi:hypothetical protein
MRFVYSRCFHMHTCSSLDDHTRATFKLVQEKFYTIQPPEDWYGSIVYFCISAALWTPEQSASNSTMSNSEPHVIPEIFQAGPMAVRKIVRMRNFESTSCRISCLERLMSSHNNSDTGRKYWGLLSNKRTFATMKEGDIPIFHEHVVNFCHGCFHQHGGKVCCT